MRISLPLVLVLSFAAVTEASTQARTISAPADNYLLEITQRWAAESPLGALPTRSFARQDIELRVWGGYGLGGTSGVILQRHAGQWRAWRVEVVPCTYGVPIPVGDTASPATESLFVRRAHESCGSSMDSTAYGQTIYSADTLAVHVVVASNLDQVWRHAVDAGVRTLPPSIPRKWMMLDGFTYVVELREGDEYRASVIEAVDKPEVEADRQVKAVYDLVRRGVPYVRSRREQH